MTVSGTLKCLVAAACVAAGASVAALESQGEGAAAVLASAEPAAQARQAAAPPAPSRRGPVTNLPLPRFVSLKAAEGNVRRGPSLTHRIDWVFKRRGMPLQITAEFGHWRRVQDRDGAGGWVHYALLSGVRTVLVEQDMLPVHARPDAHTPVTAAFELGVVARLGECTAQWCRISAGGYRGWARKDDIWGVTADELRD
ncbi:MAG: aspartyl-trna synthetase [Rhodobacteraceae bacterium]|nr:aspartyl-trna synthetase [Paracoccaceae bacterium]